MICGGSNTRHGDVDRQQGSARKTWHKVGLAPGGQRAGGCWQRAFGTREPTAGSEQRACNA